MFSSQPMLSGITPDMEVFSIPSDCRPTKLPMLDGIDPEIPLSPRPRNRRVVDRFAIELGSFPLKELYSRSKYPSWLQFASAVMNSHPSLSSASSLLLNKFRVTRPFSLPKVAGTRPLKLFRTSSRFLRAERLESEPGIVPWN
ncbi:hypothetical protein PVAP13_5KG087100 [Panicum virgatum]|uniref:Uncharacterized protein n=1 Tax=Panicum virgatum TaxID=38727 RepID=A0A8T0S8Z4_PANVG|nr:hypothetical protein PVAP13_5KG087100 [Panicum virgatum]